MTPDFWEGSYVRIAKEWRKLDGTKFEDTPRIEARQQSYGCDTGCTGYVVYLIEKDGTETELHSFDFITGDAVANALEESDKRGGIPVVVDQND